MDDSIKFSKYGNLSSIPSPVSRMMTAFAADFRDSVDINLGVGYVNEKTIPNALVKEALEEVLTKTDKYRLALNYGGPQGSPNLIDSVRRFYIENKLGGLTSEILDSKEIAIGPNGSTSILESIAHILEPGIVITADPMYYAYCNFLERIGNKIIAVPSDEKGIKIDILRDKIDKLGDAKKKISFFYVVTVDNPTSSITENERRRELTEYVTGLSRSINRKIPLFYDKAYEKIVHDPEVPLLESSMLYDELGIVYDIGTLSKVLAPALRIGYMFGPKGSFFQAMIQRASDVGFSAPLMTQEIASYILDHYGMEQFEKVRKGYRGKAVTLKKWLVEELGDSMSDCRGGQAGFYFYVTMAENINTQEGSCFYNFLSRTTGEEAIDGPSNEKFPRVVYIPGEFFVHPEGDLVEEGKRQFRLSYGYEELEKMHEAIKTMKEAAEYTVNGGGRKK